jgi:hypothetical protein
VALHVDSTKKDGAVVGELCVRVARRPHREDVHAGDGKKVTTGDGYEPIIVPLNSMLAVPLLAVELR